MNIATKKLLFYWATSFILATIFYYILWMIMPRHNVFAALFRMFLYHWEYPISFIAIPCFFYGILATIFAKTFLSQTIAKQILLTLVIITLTIFLSSPFGGMLWHYYDMKAGYFPSNWILKMIKNGFVQGLEIGWLIILLSVPYNILGAITCYFLTKKGSELFSSQ
ncbi:hypothetical protein [Winogradskyella algicola]|uniref:hypothetical protein n=1 Tax=Winogradskyella algicola TaxID=2575815 RepID=UPI0011086D94|nr:hypothetical protein [Winogradskyella algicola]